MAPVQRVHFLEHVDVDDDLRRLVGVVLVLLASSFVQALLPAHADATIRVGIRARVTPAIGVNVRTCASTACPTAVAALPQGTIVKIEGGPQSGPGGKWWRHDRGGWSIDTALTEERGATPTPTPKPLVYKATYVREGGAGDKQTVPASTGGRSGTMGTHHGANRPTVIASAKGTGPSATSPGATASSQARLSP